MKLIQKKLHNQQNRKLSISIRIQRVLKIPTNDVRDLGNKETGPVKPILDLSCNDLPTLD